MYYGWQARTAREMASRTDNLKIESWVPSDSTGEVAQEVDGVTYRAFPGRRSPFASSRSLLRAAIQLPADDIIHLHGDRSALAYALLLGTGQRKFVQHHSSRGASILSPAEALAFRKCEKIYCIAQRKIAYLRSIGIDSTRLRFRTMGVNFGHFQPDAKAAHRDRLGLREDAQVILYPARLDYPKGADVVLSAFKELKRDNSRVELVVVGNSLNDPLYQAAAKMGARIFGRMSYSDMPGFYNASDVVCWFAQPKILWAGIGVSMAESLACDVPVVSNTLEHISNVGDRRLMGVLPGTPEGLTNAIRKVLRGNMNFQCRATARRYFDWDAIIQETFHDYGLH